ncbi:MAG: hypothetical protein ACRC2V_07210 [Xenococcaceae cyanobacterium]
MSIDRSNLILFLTLNFLPRSNNLKLDRDREAQKSCKLNNET